LSEIWYKICGTNEFPEEGKLACALGEWQVLLVRDGDLFHAYNDCCTHQASRLSTGRLRRGTIMCPLHGARFKAATGESIGGAYPPLRSFPVKIEEGQILVSIPEVLPGPGEKPVLIQ
jgi:anthranilate 1,2-dioxygenase ferredoxin subunit